MNLPPMNKTRPGKRKGKGKNWKKMIMNATDCPCITCRITRMEKAAEKATKGGKA